jgi:hypothetical protein
MLNITEVLAISYGWAESSGEFLKLVHLQVGIDTYNWEVGAGCCLETPALATGYLKLFIGS